MEKSKVTFKNAGKPKSDQEKLEAIQKSRLDALKASKKTATKKTKNFNINRGLSQQLELGKQQSSVNFASKKDTDGFDPEAIMKLPSSTHKLIVALLDVFNQTKHSYIKNSSSSGRNYRHENCPLIYYKGIDWQQVLGESLEIVLRDAEFAEIIKEEELSLTQILDLFKSFYKSAFGAQIFEEKIRLLQDNMPSRSVDVQTTEEGFGK